VEYHVFDLSVFILWLLGTSDNVGIGNRRRRRAPGGDSELEGVRLPAVHGAQLRQQRREPASVRLRQRKLPSELHRGRRLPTLAAAAAAPRRRPGDADRRRAAENLRLRPQGTWRSSQRFRMRLCHGATHTCD